MTNKDSLEYQLEHMKLDDTVHPTHYMNHLLKSTNKIEQEYYGYNTNKSSKSSNNPKEEIIMGKNKQKYLVIYGYSLSNGGFKFLKRVYDKGSTIHDLDSSHYIISIDTAYPYELTSDGLYPHHYWANWNCTGIESCALSQHDINSVYNFPMFSHHVRLYIIPLKHADSDYLYKLALHIAELQTDKKVSDNFKHDTTRWNNLKKDKDNLKFMQRGGRA